MVRVVMREKQGVDLPQRDFQLPQPNGRAAAGIDHQYLVACLNQRARPEAIRQRRRRGLPSSVTVNLLCACPGTLDRRPRITRTKARDACFTKPAVIGVPRAIAAYRPICSSLAGSHKSAAQIKKYS